MDRKMEWKHKSARAKLYIWTEGTASLANVWSETRRQGHASELMQLICDYADYEKMTVVLTARPYDTPQRGAMRTQDLVKFYEKFGFEVDPTNYQITMMVRIPREKNTA